MPGKPIEQARVERAARLYGTNKEAAAALGIDHGSFGRLCRRYGVETPFMRHQRRRREAGKEPERAADRERLAHAARTHRTNVAAAQALGIDPSSFRRRCLKLGIESPSARAERQLREVREGRGAARST